MNTFCGRPSLDAVKNDEHKEKVNHQLTSMSLHAVPSAPTPTAAPAAAVGLPAAGGAKPKTKRQKVLDTVFLSLFKGKKLYTDKWMNICR